MLMRLILVSIRLYLRTLAVFSPKRAGLEAFRIFRKPRFRRQMPAAVGAVMARAELIALEIEGLQVQAFRWPHPVDRDAKRVLLVHGWESRAGRLAQWVEPLLEAGFEVVAFDAPAHGDSEGKRTSPLHFALALHALQTKLGPFWGVISHSMGCIGTALAAGGGRFLGLEDLPLERMVLIAGAESSQVAMDDFCRVLGLGEEFSRLVADAASERLGYSVDELAAHRLLKGHATPALWFHDPEDPEIPISEGERVAAACPHVTLVRSEGLGHHRIARDPGVIERGIEFLTTQPPS